MSDALAIIEFDTSHVVFYGDVDEAKAYCDELGLKPTNFLSATNAPARSDLLVTAMTCLRKHGDDLQAFYDALPLAKLLASHSEEDLYEVFDAARELHEVDQVANPDPAKMTNEKLAAWVDRRTGEKLQMASLIKEINAVRYIGLRDARAAVLASVPRLKPTMSIR